MEAWKCRRGGDGLRCVAERTMNLVFMFVGDCSFGCCAKKEMLS